VSGAGAASPGVPHGAPGLQTDMGGAGGRTADLSVEESAGGVVRVMLEAGPEMTGKFVDWRGQELPF